MHTSYLAHHGVKGMKWGVRKREVSLDSRDHQLSQRLAKKQRKELDDLYKRYPESKVLKAYESGDWDYLNKFTDEETAIQDKYGKLHDEGYACLKNKYGIA